MPTKDVLETQLTASRDKVRELEASIRELKQEREVTLEMEGLQMNRNGNGECYIVLHPGDDQQTDMEISTCEGADMITFLQEWLEDVKS